MSLGSRRRPQALFHQSKQVIRRRVGTCRTYKKCNQFINIHRLARHKIALGDRGQDCLAHRGNVCPFLDIGQDESSGAPDRSKPVEDYFGCRDVALTCGVHNSGGDIGWRCKRVNRREDIRRNITVDWAHRESARADIRRRVKRILRKYGYPPDLQDAAVQNVLQQAEALSAELA